MRRIQVLLEPELDDRLEEEAAAQGVSKSALVRSCLRERLERRPHHNGLSALTGMFEGRPDDSARIDEIVYEWRS